MREGQEGYFKFELDTGDNNAYGSINLGATDGVNSPYRITIRSSQSLSESRGGIFRVFIEQYISMPEISYWSKLKYKNVLDLNEDFSISITDQIVPKNFDWVTFYFTKDTNGLYLKKVSKPTVIDANGLGNLTLDRIISQEGYILNKFHIRVIEILVKKDKKESRKNTKEIE